MRPEELTLTAARAVCGAAVACRRNRLDRAQGARMIAQAGAEAWFRSPAGRGAPRDRTVVYGLAAVVDALHAASMAALAAVPGPWRRHALVSAGIAAGFTAADVWVCRSPHPGTTTDNPSTMEA